MKIYMVKSTGRILLQIEIFEAVRRHKDGFEWCDLFPIGLAFEREDGIIVYDPCFTDFLEDLEYIGEL